MGPNSWDIDPHRIAWRVFFSWKPRDFPRCQGVHQPSKMAQGIAQEIAKNGANRAKSTESMESLETRKTNTLNELRRC
jgi:hypothetical protein